MTGPKTGGSSFSQTMRWLILGDIHSNMEALEAVLAAAQGRYQDILCLGDIVGYGPEPEAVTTWVRTNVPKCIRGNHDKAACGIEDPAEFHYAARLANEWTQKQLSPENTNYLRQLPQGPLEVEGFLIVHGSKGDEDKYIVTQADALEELEGQRDALVFFGHTHHQGGYLLDGTGHLGEVRPTFFRGCSLVSLELLPEEHYLLNPGSVGQPRDGDIRAAFSIYDTEHQWVEWWRVPYNVEKTQRKMQEHGLPEVLVQRLGFGH